MISYISFYLLGGVIWALIIEAFNEAEIGDYKKEIMTNKQRILLILIWPLYFSIFLITFFKNYFNN